MKLIPDWKQSWRFLSVQVNAGAAALIVAITSAAPGLVVEALQAPLFVRIIVGAMVAAAFVLTHWAARVAKQDGADAE